MFLFLLAIMTIIMKKNRKSKRNLIFFIFYSNIISIIFEKKLGIYLNFLLFIILVINFNNFNIINFNNNFFTIGYILFYKSYCYLQNKNWILTRCNLCKNIKNIIVYIILINIKYLRPNIWLKIKKLLKFTKLL